MNREDAAKYLPREPTYVVRIISSFAIGHLGYPPLRRSKYFTVDEYIFDDVDPWYIPKNQVLFTEEHARDLLINFQEKGSTCSTLLVHCAMGKNRSPAVGIALNTIFGLGYIGGVLKATYPRYTEYIHDTLIITAGKMGLLPEIKTSMETFK